MSDANRLYGATFATTDCAFANNDAENGYDIATAVTYCINGKAYEKATVDDGTVPTSDPAGTAIATVADDYACLLVWTLEADGTVGLWQGAQVALDESGSFYDGKAPSFPSIDMETYCPIAYTVFKNTTGSTFTIGTTNWTTATTTVVSLLTMPQRPQIS